MESKQLTNRERAIKLLQLEQGVVMNEEATKRLIDKLEILLYQIEQLGFNAGYNQGYENGFEANVT